MRPIVRLAPLFLLAAGACAATGCSMDPPVNVKYKWTLKPGEMKWYTEESEPQGKRRVNVSMDPFPKDANVAVAIIFKEDLEDAKNAMKKGDEPPKSLRSHPGGGPVKFEPVVLAPGKAFAVIVKNGVDESAEIQLKIEAK